MILIPIFLVGIACILAGIALGGTLYSYELHTGEDGAEYKTETTTLSPSEAEQIHSIDWNIRTSEIEIVNGDHYSISGSGRYHSYIKDGVWHIKTDKKTASITFLSHRFEIPYFWNHSFTSKNTITIPADCSYETADINIAAGSLTGEELHADNIILKTGAGSCTLEQITAKKLSVKVGAGSSTLRKISVSDSCTAEVGAGELVLGSKKIPAGVNTISNLHGKCAAGNMTVTGKITGDSQLECSLGEIDMLLDGYRHNYRIDSHDSLGEIDINEGDADDDWDSIEDSIEEAIEDDLEELEDDIEDDYYLKHNYNSNHDYLEHNYNSNHDYDHEADHSQSQHHSAVITPTPDVSGAKKQATPSPTTGNGNETHHGNLILKCSMGDITVKFQH